MDRMHARRVEQERRRLVVVTDSYPYGTREGFIEEELEALSSEFTAVVVAPITIAGTPRQVPSNVLVDTNLARQGFLASLGSMPRCVWREIRTEARRNLGALLTASGFRRFLGFTVRALRVYRWARTDLSQAITSNTLYYSYWLGEGAVGLALAARCARDLRFVARAHGWDIYAERHRPPYLPFRPLILDTVQAVYLVSRDGSDYLARTHPSAKDRLSVERLGVRGAAKRSPPSAAGELRVVSCSFVTDVKRLDLLVRALAEFGRTWPDVRLSWLHIGGGPLLSELSELARRTLGSGISWEFLGTVSRRQIMDVYESTPIDVFINLSKSEGLPVAIMEAMSAGIPVIATAVGGVPEIVREDNGLLLAEDPTEQDVVAALGTFVRKGEETQRMRAASRRIWQAEFDASSNYRSFAVRLTSLLPSK